MAALLLCVPLFARFFPLWASKAPVFTDIIIETTAKTGINKQGELTLFRLLTVLGLLLCCLTGFLLSARQMKHMAETPETAQADKHPAYLRYLWIFVFPLLGSFIIFGQKDTVLFLGLCYFCVLAVCLHFKKEQALFYPCLVLPVLLYYALMAVLTVLVQISDRFILSDNQVIGTASALTLMSLLICCLPKTETDKKAERLSLLLCILQLPIPFLLVVYFVDHYLYLFFTAAPRTARGIYTAHVSYRKRDPKHAVCKYRPDGSTGQPACFPPHQLCYRYDDLHLSFL